MGSGRYTEETDKSLTVLGKRASTQNRLEERRKRLEEELKAVNAAILLFQDHPQIAEALDLLGQINM